ncbi:MAG: TrkA family potassium uptake protein [Dehalococcoidia bacterium]|nr:TrkA family potassium uptake protein [Dehalococcoidia bacterium]
MKVLIMGCGRVGARVAGLLDSQGHEVVILDVRQAAFRRLPHGFGGTPVLGNSMDGPTLERAGIRGAGAFIAVTQGDNRNYFASQLAREVYGVPRVLCRTYDPIRGDLFSELGLETFSPTRIGADLVLNWLLGEAEAT